MQVVADLGGRAADVGGPESLSGGLGTASPTGRACSPTAATRRPAPSVPYRKPPGGELSGVYRACNYSLSRLRASVERAIAHLKNWKILKTGYHRHMASFPDMLRTVTGLEIFRAWRPF